ncbi:MAG: hypothetical protein K5663_05560 [Clostridiales bacterium]|nr:hypothetical protein [Clostridiales bacterium]
MTLGYMPMPDGFRYRQIALKGRPVHAKWDSFSLRHPPMSVSRWAKIFSPFDALRGFSEAISSRETEYTARIEPDDDRANELSRRLGILRELSLNRRNAGLDRISVTVRYFVPCADKEHPAFGNAGTYETVTGAVLRTDTESERTLSLQTPRGTAVINLDGILSITAKPDIFSSCLINRP